MQQLKNLLVYIEKLQVYFSKVECNRIKQTPLT